LHCREIEEQATERMDFMTTQLAEHYQVTEDLKAADAALIVVFGAVAELERGYILQRQAEV